MTEIRFHSSDPSQATRRLPLQGRSGVVAAVLLLAAGSLVLFGLLGAPGLVSYLVRSAERLSLRQTAQKGREAFESVERRFRTLAGRVTADELFLVRVAMMGGVPLPTNLPSTPPPVEALTPTDLEFEVARLSRELRGLEGFRRRLAASPYPDAKKVPSRSPIEPSSAVLLSVFGPRVSPLTHRPEFHTGISLAAFAGTSVVAPADGTVLFAGPVPGKWPSGWRRLGTVVVIAHGERLFTVYGHLQKAAARPRTAVRRGETIARVGQSGWAQTPQLQYEVWRETDGSLVPVDPRIYILDADWIRAAELRALPVPPADVEPPPPLR